MRQPISAFLGDTVFLGERILLPLSTLPGVFMGEAFTAARNGIHVVTKTEGKKKKTK